MTRETPPSRKELQRLGWRDENPRAGHKPTARYVHRDGWLLMHCGHPTANWPYALYDSKGRMHLSGGVKTKPTFGVAWRSVRQAVEYVAMHAELAIAMMDREVETAPADVRWLREPPSLTLREIGWSVRAPSAGADSGCTQRAESHASAVGHARCSALLHDSRPGGGAVVGGGSGVSSGAGGA